MRYVPMSYEVMYGPPAALEEAARQRLTRSYRGYGQMEEPEKRTGRDVLFALAGGALGAFLGFFGGYMWGRWEEEKGWRAYTRRRSR